MESRKFSASRWGRLTLARLVDDARPLGWALAVVVGLNLVTLVVFRNLIFSDRHLWSLFVAVASILTASGAFRSMHEGRSSTDWILWPATALEKYAAAVAEVVVVPLALGLASFLASAALSGVQLLFTGEAASLWFPWNGFSGTSALGFLVFLLVVLTGAVSFRKHALWKTGLVLVGLGLVSTLLIYGVFTVLGLPGGIQGHWGARRMTFFQFNGPGASWHPSEGASNLASILAQVWYFGLLPAFCLVFGWTKVREKEARDEVQ